MPHTFATRALLHCVLRRRMPSSVLVCVTGAGTPAYACTFTCRCDSPPHTATLRTPRFFTITAAGCYKRTRYVCRDCLPGFTRRAPFAFAWFTLTRCRPIHYRTLFAVRCRCHLRAAVAPHYLTFPGCCVLVAFIYGVLLRYNCPATPPHAPPAPWTVRGVFAFGFPRTHAHYVARISCYLLVLFLVLPLPALPHTHTHTHAFTHALPFCPGPYPAPHRTFHHLVHTQARRYRAGIAFLRALTPTYCRMPATLLPPHTTTATVPLRAYSCLRTRARVAVYCYPPAPSPRFLRHATLPHPAWFFPIALPGLHYRHLPHTATATTPSAIHICWLDIVAVVACPLAGLAFSAHP